MKQNRFKEILYLIFRKDIGRKAMALILAVILWIYLDFRLVLSEEYDISLEVVSEQDFNKASSRVERGFYFVIPDKLMLEENLQDQYLHMTLTGSKDLIPARLIGKRVITMSEMGDLDNRSMDIPIIREYFDVLNDPKRERVLVGEFNPQKVTLKLARRDHAEIRLTPANLEIKGLADLEKRGFMIDEEGIRFEPSSIPIEGPAQEIARIVEDNTWLQLESIDLSKAVGLVDNHYCRLSLQMVQKKISIRAGSPSSVRVSINLEEKRVERVLAGLDVAVYFGKRPLTDEERQRIELDSGNPDAPEKVNIRFLGRQDMLDGLGRDEDLRRKIELRINLAKGDGAGSLTLDDAIARLPDSFDIVTRVNLGAFDASITIVQDQLGLTVRRKQLQ